MKDSNSEIWMIVDVQNDKRGGRHSSEYAGPVGFDDEEPEESSLDSEARIPLDVGKLKTKTKQFMKVVGDLFADADREAQKGMQLEEIELSVGLDAEGEIGFWGVGKANVTGATEIKLTFKRKE